MSTSSDTVSERLVAFVRAWTTRGVPDAVLHEANRLLINQLKASVGAVDHPAVSILRDWAVENGPGRASASVLWSNAVVTPERATVVNGALFEVLDFNDTYIPTFMHSVSGVLPAVLAAAENGVHGVRPTGHAVLTALALGIEAELACATILMPTGYYRGFVPGGLVGAIGGAIACGLLWNLDDAQLRNAIGLTMCSAFGTYESVGSDALAYIMGATARSGYVAADLARHGLNAPRTAFEGEKGQLASHSDEPASKIETVLSTLGETWRIFGHSYKTVPTETITHAPIEAVLAILPRAGGRVVDRMRFGVQDIVVRIADERRDRFGLPTTDQQARFDLRFCVAAAWMRARFTLAEMAEPAYTDPAILALRERVDLVADPGHPTFEGASLTVLFTDGTEERVVIPAFRGTPGNPMTDDELSALFRVSAEAQLASTRIDDVLDAAWGLRNAPDIAPLMTLLRGD